MAGVGLSMPVAKIAATCAFNELLDAFLELETTLL